MVSGILEVGVDFGLLLVSFGCWGDFLFCPAVDFVGEQICSPSDEAKDAAVWLTEFSFNLISSGVTPCCELELLRPMDGGAVGWDEGVADFILLSSCMFVFFLADTAALRGDDRVGGFVCCFFFGEVSAMELVVLSFFASGSRTVSFEKAY